MDIYYKDENIGTRRVDFFVEGKVMVELKAIIHLEDVHLAQAINYLEAYGLGIGLLVNFGAKSLEFKRVMKPVKKSKSINQIILITVQRQTTKSNVHQPNHIQSLVVLQYPS